MAQPLARPEGMSRHEPFDFGAPCTPRIPLVDERGPGTRAAQRNHPERRGRHGLVEADRFLLHHDEHDERRFAFLPQFLRPFPLLFNKG